MIMIKKFLLLLREFKGAIASFLGFLMAFPCNLLVVYKYYVGETSTKESLIELAVINGIAMIWFILPSKIEITSSLFNLKLED